MAAPPAPNNGGAGEQARKSVGAGTVIGPDPSGSPIIGGGGGRRIRLLLEYDGTDFAGFQIQGKGERTVQGTLEAAIERLSGKTCRVHGAGRTDAGVHATGQVAHFETEWPIPTERLAFALNGALTRDLVAKDATDAPEGFHARFSATSRTYRYVILNRTAPSALLGRYALHMREPLDIAAMRAAAVGLTGRHDFAAFGQPDTPGKSTVRDVKRVTVQPWKDCLLLTVRGNAFLRQMVRSFVGTLLLVGQGKLTVDEVRAIRESGDRSQCPAVAPAHGLCLVRVDYDGQRYDGNSRDSSSTSNRNTDHEDLFGEAE